MELNASQKLASYVDALRPIIYIHSFDFQAVDLLKTIGDRRSQ